MWVGGGAGGAGGGLRGADGRPQVHESVASLGRLINTPLDPPAARGSVFPYSFIITPIKYSG